MFIYFLNTRIYPILFAVNLSLIYLSVLIYFIFNKSFSLYMCYFFIFFLFILPVLMFIDFKKSLATLRKEIEYLDFQAFKENILRTYKQGDVLSLFQKIEYAKSIVDTRFASSIFKDRLSSLISDSSSSFIENLKVISEMESVKNKSEYSYEKDIKEMKDSNKKILSNLDLLIKEILIERKENNETSELNEIFSRNLDLFEKMKGF
jgi:hypothetical protein